MKASNLARYVLLAAIAALGLMLLVEWQKFSTAHKAVPAVASTPVPAAAELPQPAAAAANAIPADVPQVTATAPAAGVPAASPSALVHVRTDTLDVSIDLHGGDVVRAALPEHLAKLDAHEQSFVLLESGPARTYIAQSGLVGPNGTDTNTGSRPVFSSAAPEYSLAAGDRQLVVDLVLDAGNGVAITKRFTFERGSYLVRMDYLVNNQGEAPWQAALYGQLKRDDSTDPSADDGRFGVKPFLGVASTTDDKRFLKIPFKKIPDEKFSTRKTDGWIAVIQHYFLGAWIPAKGVAADYSAVQSGGFNYARFTTPVVGVAPGAQGQLSAALYVGPKDQHRLQAIAPNLDLSVDYGWLWWIAQPLFWLLTQFHHYLGNWGFSIIALTVFVKAVFFRLSASSYRSMANMRRVQPKLAALKDRYGDDRQKMSQAMMELYRKEKINPLGGCLPILIQMPVFISLYWVLMESVELRHAPFIGYIHDLSSMDPYFIMPLIMGASMFVQQKLNPPPPDPMQAKVMQWMPVIFTVFFLWFPSGLVLYWIVNNSLSIAQQWVITRSIEKAASHD